MNLPIPIEVRDVTVGFECAVSNQQTKSKTTIQHKTWSVEEVSEQMFQKLKATDEESKAAEDPRDRNNDIKRLPREKCTEIIRTPLKRGKVTTDRITEANRQRFWQAIRPLRWNRLGALSISSRRKHPQEP